MTNLIEDILFFSNSMTQKNAVLLINLGTPGSPKPRDVWRYLIEFLTDRRVIDYPWLKRQLLVRGLIVPARYRNSAKSYQCIWTDNGSPLLVYGKQVQRLLQKRLGEDWQVALAMRYQKPSIASVLEQLKSVKRLVILPLYPQYASASTGTVHQEVMRIISKWQVIPELKFINNFATHPKLIEAFCSIAHDYLLKEYDHILFSFHGLPTRQLTKADLTGCCLKTPNCCQKNGPCYSAQCHATARAIANHLKIDHYRICFQSRLGKEPWLEPYLSDVLDQMLSEGKKRLLVFSPSFICDCLETTHEIEIEYREEFLKKGGESLDLIPGLNTHPLWIETLYQLVT